MKPSQSSAIFFSGIHMDMLGALCAPALLGASNPGKFTAMPGGASLNAASVASLLGLDCAVIGLVGDDANGEILKQTLRERKITSLLTSKKQRATGSYTSLIEPDGNLLIALADLALNEEMDAQWLLGAHEKAMADADIWFLNANLTSQTLLQLCNPALPQRPSILAAASISVSKSENLRPSLPHIDVLFTNIAEANAMLGKTQNAQMCIHAFQEFGIRNGSLSQGPNLLWVWDEQGICSFKPPANKAITDVTGAGDALAGTFLAGLSRQKPMREFAPLAIAAAQMTIAVKGPYNAKICLQELTRHAANIQQLNKSPTI